MSSMGDNPSVSHDEKTPITGGYPSEPPPSYVSCFVYFAHFFNVDFEHVGSKLHAVTISNVKFIESFHRNLYQYHQHQHQHQKAYNHHRCQG